MIDIFRKYGLKIEISMNDTRANYLDVTMDIREGSFEPFIKPKSKLKYVYSQSHHWDLILKRIPQGVEDRLNRISSSRAKFEGMKTQFQHALIGSKYNYELKWKEKNTREEKTRRRKKPVTWFNPPWSKIIKTNVGREYIKLVRK